MLDDTIKTSEDVEKYLGMSTLGMIPVKEDEKHSKSHKSSKSSKSGSSHHKDSGGSAQAAKERSSSLTVEPDLTSDLEDSMRALDAERDWDADQNQAGEQKHTQETEQES